MILGFIAIVITLSFVFANNTKTGKNAGTGKNNLKDSTISAKVTITTGTSKQVNVKKGEILLTADSLALYKKSDSLLMQQADKNGMIPAGFTLTEKPR